MARPTDLSQQIHAVVLNKETPLPPYHLTDDQANIWNQLFMTTQPDWVTAPQYNLVINLCRHIDYANKYSKMLESMLADSLTKIPNSNDIKDIDRIAKMFERESRSVSSLKTKLRLTNQSLRSHKSDQPIAKRNPWDIDEDMEIAVVEKSHGKK